MSENKAPQYSLPGISNPVEPEKSNKRKYASIDGSIDVSVFGPIPVDDPEPNLELYIYLDYGRELLNVLSDKKNACVLKRASDGSQKAYFLQINKDNLLVSRGSYILSIVKDGEEIERCVIVVSNHPARQDSIYYTWPFVSDVSDYRAGSSDLIDSLLARIEDAETKISGITSDTSVDWVEFAIQYKPSTETVVSGGTVIQYDSDTNTVYRFIPDPYDYDTDGFYQNFDGTNVSNLIVTRK